jgi:hypothetical protein
MMKCPTTSQPQQKPIGKPQGSKALKSVVEFYAELKKRGGVVSEAKDVEAAFAREFGILLTSAAHAPVLKGYSKIQNLLATALGFKSTVLGAVDLAMTEAGATRYLLQTKAKEANKLLQLAALNKSLPKIRELSAEFAKALPSMEKARMEELLHDHIVIGQFPKLQNIYDSPVVRVQLAQRYQEHTARLLDEGVSPAAIKKMDELAGEITQSFDNARIIAGKYGLDVKALTNGGYFPIQAQDTIAKLLEAAQETSRANTSKQVFDTAKMLNSSRTSTMPAVLDLDKAAAVLGMSNIELAMTLTNPGGISSYLRKKFDADTLQKLYDNGTLTQIPALSDELTTFFAEELDLPIKGLGDAIILDPERAIKKYNDELAKATENSAMVQTALEEGIKYGWVLDESQIITLANRKDYVKVGSDKLFQELFRSDKLREGIANLYIHRTLKDQLNALTEANTSLITLGHIGGGIQAFLKFTGFTKRTMIFAAGLPYIGRVFGQNAISLNAATGSKGMFYYANGLAEVARATTSKEGSGVLSSSFFASIGGKDFSLKELFDTTFFRRSVDNLSITGEKLEPNTAKQKLMDAFDPVSRERFFRHMAVYHERYGSPATGKIGSKVNFGLEIANNAFKLGYEQLAKANQYLDFAARWTAVRTLALDPSLAGKEKWKDIDELLRYTDEYFNVNTDVGSVGKTAGQYLVPFASFALVAPGVTLRHTLRHPWRYARMMSLYAQSNASNDLTDAEISQFQKDSYPVFIGKDPISGKRFSVNPGTIDSFLDTTTWAKENFEKVARAFGAPVGSVKEITDSKIDPTKDLTDSVAEIFERTYLTTGIGAAFFGVDPQTGEKFNDVPENDTLLGIGMTRRIRAAIVETLPVLRSLDRNLPTSIVGASTVQDPVSLQVTREGTPGLFGNVPSSGGTPKPKNLESAGVVGWILNTGGLTLSEIDPKANLIRNYNDFGYVANDLKNARNRLEVKIGSRPDGLEKEQMLEERTRLLQIEGLLEYNQLLVNRLAIEKGYPLPKALQMIRQQLTTARDIPQEARLEFFRQQTQGAK